MKHTHTQKKKRKKKKDAERKLAHTIGGIRAVTGTCSSTFPPASRNASLSITETRTKRKERDR